MIQLTNVSKELKKNKVLNDLNCTFSAGKAYLLSGHNGSGKTMLLRVLCKLIKPTVGEVIYDGEYSFGVVIENPSFMDSYTGWKNLMFLASINKRIGEEQIAETMKRLDLYQHKDKRVKTYSLGMKQRLGICQAIMENQDVILLDEPFNALDAAGNEIVKALILELKKQGKTIIIAAHGINPQSQDIFDETIVMDNGKIVS